MALTEMESGHGEKKKFIRWLKTYLAEKMGKT
jgi:hypothetical protein